METKKSTHGGLREGAGRKKVKGTKITFRPDMEFETTLQSQPDRSKYINRCLREHVAQAQQSQHHLPQFYQLSVETELSIPYSEQKLVAGFPNPVDASYLEHAIDLNREFIENPASTFCARVVGDSMIDAGVNAGDYLLIDKLKEPVATSLVVCCLNDEFTLKYVKHDETGTWLVPANKNYKPIPVTPEDDFRIWGVVTGLIRKM